MNTENKAAHDALSTTQRSAARDVNSSKDKLVADLKILVADAEKMIKEAADSSADGFTALRARFEGKLVDAKAQLEKAKTAVGEKAQHATESAHAYVKANPLQAVGVLAAVGTLFGNLLGRKSGGSGGDAAKKD